VVEVCASMIGGGLKLIGRGFNPAGGG